ncbi:(deoxy)nucleoside triphosphate pyrophosphohydrolase [Sphingomonas sp. RS6]
MLVVAAAMLREGRVLVQRRPAGKPMAGLWEFPGGKVEPGEAPESALARELGEELGVTVNPATIAPLSFASESLASRHLVLLLYRIDHWQSEPEARHASALHWADAAELRALPMPPADLPFLDVLAPLLGGGV